MKNLIVANWKMNPQTLKEAQRLFDAVKSGVGRIKNSEAVFCPPFVYLESLSSKFGRKGSIFLGAQDCFWQESGAYTGEISPAMLKNLGCRYVICGHSERRENMNENDEMVNRKIRAVLEAGMTPILCVGEKSRTLPDYEKFIQGEVEAGLANVGRGMTSGLAIAYEPIWAIGSGHPATTDDALSVGLLIKKTLTKLYGRPLADRIRLLYGGSVNSSNAANYVAGSGLNGLLVGGASLNASEFVKTINSLE